MARHGPILRENEATASAKLFKQLPGPPGPVFEPKTTAKVKHLKNLKTHIKIGPRLPPGSAAWAEPLLSKGWVVQVVHKIAAAFKGRLIGS